MSHPGHQAVPGPRPGDLIAGRYRLCAPIGGGGMAVVFRAEHVCTGKTVALKLPRPDLGEDADIARRFRREARAASLVFHPNAVRAFDYGVVGDIPFLVMEYVPGQTLHALARREGPLPLSRALDLVEQVLAALGAAHAAGVVHGDIKSDNILVATCDGIDRVKIIDFGLARLADPRLDESAGAAAAGALMCGTPEYMAPELICGERATTTTDLYAVGVVLCELLTGDTPFASGSVPDTLSRHFDERLVAQLAVRVGRRFAPGLDAVIAKALARTPAERFSTAAELLAALALVRAAMATCRRGSPGERDDEHDAPASGVADTMRWLPTVSELPTLCCRPRQAGACRRRAA